MELMELNELDREAFTAALADIFEHSPWIGEATWNRRPFKSLEDLHDQLCQTLDASDNDRKLDLIRAHPDLAGKLAVAGELTQFSTAEQASAQLDKLTSEQFEKDVRPQPHLQREVWFSVYHLCKRAHPSRNLPTLRRTRESHSRRRT